MNTELESRFRTVRRAADDHKSSLVRQLIGEFDNDKMNVCTWASVV